MSTAVAVALAVMAGLSLSFVFSKATSPFGVEADKASMKELRHKLSMVDRARQAYIRKKEFDEINGDIRKNRDIYEKYISILNDKKKTVTQSRGEPEFSDEESDFKAEAKDE